MHRLVSLFLLLSLLTGCAAAPILVAGGAAATGVVVANDRRTAGTMLDDQSLELKIQQKIAADAELVGNSRVSVTSYNGVVLLTGQTLQESQRQRIAQLASAQPTVREVRNVLQVGPLSDAVSRNRDTLLTTRVKSRLIASDEVQAGHIKVVSEQATVYLMGLVTREEADRVVDVVRSTEGVVRIVKVFEYTYAPDTAGD